MPSVCVCGCGFTTDGGQLCPDWAAFGLKAAQTDVAGPSDGASTNETDGWIIIQAIRLAYTNDTCQQQRVQVTALCPYVNYNLSGANYWDFALYAGAQLDTPPDSSTFQLSFSGRIRLSNPNPAVLYRFSVPARTPDQFFAVPPGRTLHMIGSTWRSIYDSSGQPNNEMSYNRLELNYRALPDGM